MKYNYKYKLVFFANGSVKRAIKKIRSRNVSNLFYKQKDKLN